MHAWDQAMLRMAQGLNLPFQASNIASIQFQGLNFIVKQAD
jgi:hypothetical protein